MITQTLTRTNKSKLSRGRPSRKPQVGSSSSSSSSHSSHSSQEQVSASSKKRVAKAKAKAKSRSKSDNSSDHKKGGRASSPSPPKVTKKASTRLSKTKPLETQKQADSLKDKKKSKPKPSELEEKDNSLPTPQPERASGSESQPANNPGLKKANSQAKQKPSQRDSRLPSAIDKEAKSGETDRAGTKVGPQAEATAKKAKVPEDQSKAKKSTEEKPIAEETKMEVDEETEDKGKGTKRPMKPAPKPEVKRRKTEKGEKLVVGEKRKIKHVEWQYGKHCSKDLWIGKKVKVKIPAKNKDEDSEYKFGKIVNIKESEAKDKGGQIVEGKVLIQVEWTNDKKKGKEWINIRDTRVYIFGQILFMKHNHDNDQIEFISKTYGWKGKEKKAIPIPVIELIDTSDKCKSITPHQDPSEKIPLQYFMIEKAKKIKQEVLYDYREFKEEYFDYLRDNVKNGEKLLSKIMKYKKHYSQWIDKYSKIDIDMTETLKSYCTKIVRVYKGDRNCGKAIILRVLNEEGRREILLVRYLKNSKTEWLDIFDDSEESKESKISLKYDQIKGVVIYKSLRDSIVPKSRMVLPYEFVDEDKELKTLSEDDWKVGSSCYKDGINPPDSSKSTQKCEICKDDIKENTFCFCNSCEKYFHSDCLPIELTRIPVRENSWKCRKCCKCVNCVSCHLDQKDEHLTSLEMMYPTANNPILTCYICNVSSHLKCLPPDVANSIPSLKPEKPIKWRCNRCVHCLSCKARCAGKTRNNKWSRDFILCSECFRKKERKEFCPICKQFWSYTKNAAEYSMIECTSCRMWIHRICDYHLTEEVFEGFEEGINKEYNCMLCRQEKRKQYISKILNIAEKEDKLGWFKEPYEQEEYKRIIKNPMYFSKMRHNIDQYLIDVNMLKDHFNLIFTNAFNYNKPKDRAYKDAEKVQETVNRILERKWDKLIEKQDMSIEEQEHQEWVIKEIEADPGFLDKSEDVIVPQRRFKYVQSKLKQEIEELNDTVKENEKENSSGPSEQESEVESSALSGKLRKRKRNFKYTEDENFGQFDLKGVTGKSSVSEGVGQSKKGISSSKNKKNTEVNFSSDEELQERKNITSLKDIDFSHPSNFTAKYLLENPEELEDMDLKQYYHNPVRLCFDDPTLAFAPICFLCGAFGNEEEFIFCNLCGESFHPFCIKFNDEDKEKIQEYWKCLNCRFCEACSSADKEKFLLYCDICDKAYHTFCLKPKLVTVPSCGWRCHDCFKCTQCGTGNFFKNRDDYFATKKIDYSISKDFTLCIECSIEEYNKNSSEQKCEKCGEKLKWSSDEFKNRECLDCLIKNKTCNSKVLARENCECYINIHQISTRHSLLSYLCKHTLEPFLSKFGNSAGTLIKHFVNDNADFFREDIVIMEWLHVLEMGVKFENEEIEFVSNKAPQRKITGQKLSANSPDKKKSSKDQQNISESASNSKSLASNYREMSRRINCKFERKKRKYKKKQVEYIGWYYDEINYAKVKDLIESVIISSPNKEEQSFYENACRIAYMQNSAKFNTFRYDDVKNYVLPNIIDPKYPVLMNQSLKCLYLIESYNKFCNPLLNKTIKSNGISFTLRSSLENYVYYKPSRINIPVRSDVNSLVCLSKWKDFTDSDAIFEDEESNNDFWLTQKALFLSKEEFPSDFKERFMNFDIEMKEQESPIKNIEENKAHYHQKIKSKTAAASLRNDKEISLRQWDVNLRDKLNLNKYTKTLYMGQTLLKHRMNEHKETFLPKAYTPFRFSNQEVYKIIKPEEPEKIMKEINLDQSFEVDYVELLTKHEFPAVLRLKKKFMTWLCKYMNDKIQMKKRDIEEKKLQKEEEERLKKMKEEEEADMKAKKDNKVEPVLPKPKADIVKFHNIDDIDPIEENPSQNLICAFCSRKGQRKLSGRLIPFRANQFIHVNCALWTKGVFDDSEGHIINFYFMYKKARLTKCSLCGELGASVSCERAKCENIYHFPCALKIECHFSVYNKSMLYCPGCSKLYGLAPGYSDQKKTLDTKRRLYIVKHKEFQSDLAKNNEIKIDTWRPYFYDSFNRVGNCTIFSLCENVDALIKVIKGGSFSLHNDTNSKTAFLNNSNFKLKPYTSLRIYWKVMKDTTLETTQLIAESNVCKDKSKAFYLCCGEDVQVFTHPDPKLIRKSTSETITQRIWGNNRNFIINKSFIKPSSGDTVMTPEVLSIKSNHFWESLTLFIKNSRPLFSFNNIDFKYKTFTGEEKFPVQFWNTAKVDTKDKLLMSVEAHWKLAEMYEQAEKHSVSSDLFLENVIKINHGKEKISTLFQPTSTTTKVKTRTNAVQAFEEYDEYETVTDQRNLPMSMRYRRYRENPKKVCVGASKIHCQGLFALEHFSQGDIVIEYVGEVIDNQEADRREKFYENSGMSDCYMFRLDKNRIIDASYKGNMARFLNHSCDANCNAKIESICGEKHILILANRFISKGEELTYFYNFAVESEKIECLCGAPNCLRRLN